MHKLKAKLELFSKWRQLTTIWMSLPDNCSMNHYLIKDPWNPASGTVESMKKIKPSDVTEWHRSMGQNGQTDYCPRR
jgi:hypothetical protein